MLPIRSEWLKWTTTKGLWVATGVFLLFYLLVMGVMGRFAEEGLGLSPQYVVSGQSLVGYMQMFGFVVVAVPVLGMVTQEYRYHYQQTSFLATPRRYRVALAKLLVAVLWWLLVVCVSYLLGLLVFNLFAAPEVMDAYNLSEDKDLARTLWGLPLVTALYIALVQGVAWLIRKQGGSLLLMLALPFVVEPSAGLIPKIGDNIPPYLPFRNMYAFLTGVPEPNGFPIYGSLAYFAAWAIVVFAVSVYVLHQRDAG